MARSVQRRGTASVPPHDEGEVGDPALPLAADDSGLEDAIRCVNPSPRKPSVPPVDTDDMPSATTASSPAALPLESQGSGESEDDGNLINRLEPHALARTPSPPRMMKRTLRRAMSTSLLNLPTFFNPRASQTVSRPGTPSAPSIEGTAASRTPAPTPPPVTNSSPIKCPSTETKKRTKRDDKKTRTTPHRDQVRAALTKRTFGLATASKLVSAAKNAVSEAVAGVKERKKVGRKRPRYSEASARSADAKEEEALAAAIHIATNTSMTSPSDQKTPRAGGPSSAARLRSSKSLKGSSSPHTVGFSSHRKRSRRFAPSYASLAASTGARPRFDPVGDSYLSSSVLNRKRPIPKSEECRALTESLRGVYRSPIRSQEDDEWVDEPAFLLALNEGTGDEPTPFPPFSSPSFGATRPLFMRSLAPSPASTRIPGRNDRAEASGWLCDVAKAVDSPAFMPNPSGFGFRPDLAESDAMPLLPRRPRKSASSPDSLSRAYRAVEDELDWGTVGPTGGEGFLDVSPSVRRDAQDRLWGYRPFAPEVDKIAKPDMMEQRREVDLQSDLLEMVDSGEALVRGLASAERLRTMGSFSLDNLTRNTSPPGVKVVTSSDVDSTDAAVTSGLRRSGEILAPVTPGQFGETNGLSSTRPLRPLSMSPDFDPTVTDLDHPLSTSTVNRGGRPFRPLPPLPPSSARTSSIPGTEFAPTSPLQVASRSRTSTAESDSTSTTSSSASASASSQRGQVDSDDIASAQVVDARRLSLEPVLTGSLTALRRSSTSTAGTATAPVSPVMPLNITSSGYQAFSLSPTTLKPASRLHAEGGTATAPQSESYSTDSLTPRASSTCRIPDSSPMSPFKVDFGHLPDSDPALSESAEPDTESDEQEELSVPSANLALLKSADFPLENEADSAVIRQAARYVFPTQSTSTHTEPPSSRRFPAVDEEGPDLRRTIRPGWDSARDGPLKVYQDDDSMTGTHSQVPAEIIAPPDDRQGVLTERGEATTLRRKGAVAHRPATAGRARSSSPNKEN